jgi:hypothetical protein
LPGQAETDIFPTTAANTIHSKFYQIPLSIAIKNRETVYGTVKGHASEFGENLVMVLVIFVRRGQFYLS